MASDELRKFRLQRAKDYAERHRSNSSANISSDELAAIKKKADDLDAIQKSVSDAAAVGAPLWLSYIFLLFYVAIATSGVTHTQLLLESPVDLPFLNIKLPLKAFFILAPILFLIVHAYVLAHFAMLSDKAKAFHDRLTAKVTAEIENDHAIREGLRQQLPINVFVQFLAGPTNIRESAFGVMLWVIAWTTLVGAPVLVLLLLQLQFLPYHDTRVTWLHRVVLCADLAIIWWLWMKILADRDRSCPKHRSRWMKGWDDFLWFFRKFGAPTATVLVAVFSVLFSTFPSEWNELPFRWANWAEPTEATEFIFGKVDAKNQRVTGSWPVNTLRLRSFDIYEALKVDDKKKLDWKDYLIDLRGRALDGAVFTVAKLPKADLTGAQLRGAMLVMTQLQGASLDDAQLQGASLDGTRLQGASLDGTRLQGASLEFAQLQGASLIRAQLQGASLYSAQLQGASLNRARLQGASLIRAQLQGASLFLAELQGASLVGAQLQGASLVGAQLQGASLGEAQLQSASLEDSYLWRAHWGESDPIAMTPILFAQSKWEAKNGRLNRLERHDEPWTDRTYDELREMIETQVPHGAAHDNALKRIDRLDCRKSGDDLAPCEAHMEAPPKVRIWRATLETARTDDTAYEQELAKQLRHLICTHDESAIHILRAVSVRTFPRTRTHLADAGREAPALIDDILEGNNCAVSSALTDADRARLQKIKAEALKKYLPEPSPALAKDDPSPTASPPAPLAKAPAKGKSPSLPRDPPPP